MAFEWQRHLECTYLHGFSTGPFPQQRVLPGTLFFRIKQLFLKSLECVKMRLDALAHWCWALLYHPQLQMLQPSDLSLFTQHAGLCLGVPFLGSVGYVWLSVQSALVFLTSHPSEGQALDLTPHPASFSSSGLYLSQVLHCMAASLLKHLPLDASLRPAPQSWL